MNNDQEQEVRPDWAPAEVDLDLPNAARVYDYYLGGNHNFGIDREFARQAFTILPHVREVARHNRYFAVRAIQYALDQGIDQFLDIGSGIPTVMPAHELIQQHGSKANVVYVDHEAVAISHGSAILKDLPNAEMVGGDFYKPDKIFETDEVSRLIDFDRPVCLLLIALVHFVPPQRNPQATLQRYVEKLSSGSLLAISHATIDGLNTDDPVEAKIRQDTLNFCASYKDTSTPDFVTRTKPEFAEFFTGLELVGPGIDYTQAWGNPDITEADHPARCVCLGGVARKP